MTIRFRGGISTRDFPPCFYGTHSNEVQTAGFPRCLGHPKTKYANASQFGNEVSSPERLVRETPLSTGTVARQTSESSNNTGPETSAAEAMSVSRSGGRLFRETGKFALSHPRREGLCCLTRCRLKHRPAPMMRQSS